MVERNVLACGQVARFIDGFVDHELISPLQAWVRNHISGCSTCAAAVEEKDELKRLVKSSVRNLTAPATLRDRLYGRDGNVKTTLETQRRKAF
jgi:anti-sigma factor (TIGR02949 family)